MIARGFWHKRLWLALPLLATLYVLLVLGALKKGEVTTEVFASYS